MFNEYFDYFDHYSLFFKLKYMLKPNLGFLLISSSNIQSNTLGHPLRCKPQPFCTYTNFWAFAYSISPNLGFQSNGIITVHSGPLIGVRPKIFFPLGQNELIESWGILCV